MSPTSSSPSSPADLSVTETIYSILGELRNPEIAEKAARDPEMMLLIGRLEIINAARLGETTATVPALVDGKIVMRVIPIYSTRDEMIAAHMDPDLRDDNGVVHDHVFVADDGTKSFDDEAVTAMNAHWEAGGFHGLQRDVGHGTETVEQYRTRCVPRITAGQTRGQRSRDSHGTRAGRRRTAASSETSSSDPGGDSNSDESEPPSSGRLCAAGCGRPAPARGNGATCAACRQKRARARKVKTWQDLVHEIQAVEEQIERLLKARHEAWRLAAFVGGDKFLTKGLTDDLQEQFTIRARLLAEYKADALDAPRCGCGRTLERREDGGLRCRALLVLEDGGVRCLKCGRDGLAQIAPFRGRSASSVEVPTPPMRTKLIMSTPAYRRRKAVVA